MIDIFWIAIDKLTPNVRNARTHSRKQIRQIADSIAAFGFVVPIVIDEDGVIIAGHGRYAAAKLNDLKEVPAIKVQGLSEAKRRALALADNRIAENAGWDREILAAELLELAEILVVEGLDVSITGFSQIEIDQLVVDFEQVTSDPDDAIDPKWTTAAPVSKPGDLWALGKHRLLCGDARTADHVARLMGTPAPRWPSLIRPTMFARATSWAAAGPSMPSSRWHPGIPPARILWRSSKARWQKRRRSRGMALFITSAWTGATSANSSKPVAWSTARCSTLRSG